MIIPEAIAGSPDPIYVGGIRFKSTFVAGIENDISPVWIFKMLKASNGYPVLIKHTMVATERWVKSRIYQIGEDTI
jgi:hypothetical protein